MPVLERLGTENLAGLRGRPRAPRDRLRLELAGDLVAILEPYQEAWIEDEVELLRRFGHDVEVFDGAGDARRGRVADLPRRGSGTGPARACSTPAGSPTGCAAAAQRRGCGSSSARGRRGSSGAAATASTSRRRRGRVRARGGSLLATSAFPPLLRAIRRYIVPVYDYALVTEPLSAAQRDAIGWRRRQGLVGRRATSSTTTA